MKGKTILIILASIGFITMAVLLVTKIGDIGKMQASVSYDKYGCPIDGKKWTHTSTDNDIYCTAEISFTYSCADGYKWSSNLQKCYKSATKGGNNYYCPSSDKKVTNNPRLGSGTYCTRNKDKKVCSGTITNGKCYITQKSKVKRYQITDNSWKKLNGWKDGCYYKNGKALTGQREIGSDYYYLLVPGMTFAGKTYSTCKAIKYSWQYVPEWKTWVYGTGSYKKDSNLPTVFLKNGSYKINGTTYKFNKNGYCVSSNCSKLSSKDEDNLLPIGDGKGSDLNGWSNGHYYAGGLPVTGLNNIDGKWYYQTKIDYNTGNINTYQYKWHCDKKKKAYWYGYNNKYYLKNGSYKINGTTYKFDSKGYCTGSNCQNNKCK